MVALLPRVTSSQVYEGRELVQAQLVANTAVVARGQPFTVGVLLRMVPHWHTYWKFPGDAGIPTEIKWKLSEGWKVSEIQWPTPLKIIEPGDIQIYGYHDEVLLLQEITPPASLSNSSIKLDAEVNWLVCEKICIPGGTTVQLELPVGGSPAAANEDLFTRYRRALPQPWPTGDAAETNWSRSESELVLRIKSGVLANHPEVAFFPLPPEGVVIAHPATERTADGVTFRIPLEEAGPSITAINGLVVFGQTPDGPERNAWQIRAGQPTAAARAWRRPHRRKASRSSSSSASSAV